MNVSPSRWQSFEAGLLVATLAFPTLMAVHQAPQAVFYSEWLAALGLVILVGIHTQSRERRLVLSLSTALLWVSFVVAAFWPRVWGAGGGPGSALGYALYLGVFVFSASLVCGKHTDGAGSPIAVGLLCCAAGQSVVAFFQLFDMDLGGLVLKKVYAAVFGNVGQSNHFASLSWLGLAGLLYLFAHRKVSFVLLAALATWLNLMVSASGSRGAWLYTALFLVASIWLWVRGRNEAAVRRLARAAGMIALISIGAQVAASLGLFERFGLLSAAERLTAQGSNGQRLHDWSVALRAIGTHPWLGAGPGSFYQLTVDAAVAGPVLPFPMFGENAHNLALQLGAELGIPLVAVVVVLGVGWAWRNLMAAPTPERVLALTGLGVVVLHGMVEYPFWYSYFVIPAGLFWGLGEAGGRAGTRFALSRITTVVCFTVGLSCLGWVMHDWIVVRSAHVVLEVGNSQWSDPRIPEMRRELAAISDWSLFADEARIQAIQAWRPERAGASKIASDCDTSWRVSPDWTAMIRCSNAYAAAGRAEDTLRIMTALCRGFPSYHKLLREWLRREPDLGGVRPETLACLGERAP